MKKPKKIFLNRGYIEVPGGTYYDADKWREAITVISKWLEQEHCEDMVVKTGIWIDNADKIDAQFGKHTYKCSECGNYAEYFISGTEV